MAAPIRMYVTSWCPDCRRARNFLNARQLAFEEIDIEANAQAAEFVKTVNSGKRRVPTFVVGERVFAISPFDAAKMTRELGS